MVHAHIGRDGFAAIVCPAVGAHYADHSRGSMKKFNRGAENPSFSGGSGKRHSNREGA